MKIIFIDVRCYFRWKTSVGQILERYRTVLRSAIILFQQTSIPLVDIIWNSYKRLFMFSYHWCRVVEWGVIWKAPLSLMNSWILFSRPCSYKNISSLSILGMILCLCYLLLWAYPLSYRTCPTRWFCVLQNEVSILYNPPVAQSQRLNDRDCSPKSWSIFIIIFRNFIITTFSQLS